MYFLGGWEFECDEHDCFRYIPLFFSPHSLIANGDLISPASRLLIPKKALNQWDHVLQMVTEKITLRSGAVHRCVVTSSHRGTVWESSKMSPKALKSLTPRFDVWPIPLSYSASVSFYEDYDIPRDFSGALPNSTWHAGTHQETLPALGILVWSHKQAPSHFKGEGLLSRSSLLFHS